ncbi:ADP-ribosylglycohydrolase family protein [Streptomyces griseoviridis]|uniref:ADP-ribosylglycohydrolase n=1 Tax=Streptomyces griseoviridis TaxID=45398 RepID=A0A918L9K8_STRGD|nr:ADP-ribosylglycohydrolase family protein [Streptomyces niveoruber]GGS22551.1 hypothetical protein GCM10010238_08760 [Streptomyces niveoruber]
MAGTALRERARGALLGLAVGDALGAPAENLKPSEIRARWGRVTGYVAERPAGTDDTEYAIFSGLLLARHGAALTPAHVEAAWHEWIADRDEGPFRGAGFSERGTLENLRRGLAAPISAQHRHAWSDGLAMRAAPYGVFAAGRPAEAARLVAVDGSVSHDGEGIYGGQAVAAGVAAAMAGAPVVAVVAAALAVVADDSWTARSLRRAVTAAHRGERAVRSAVVVGGYPWTDLAPEAVALAFGAYAAAGGDFRDAVLTAVNMGRDADTTAAVAGALAGATGGAAAIPAEWAAVIGPARGSCLPAMAGHHVLEVADLLTLTRDTSVSTLADPAPDTSGKSPADPTPNTSVRTLAGVAPDTTARTPAGAAPDTTARTPADPTPDTSGKSPADPAPDTTARTPADPTPDTSGKSPADPAPDTSVRTLACAAPAPSATLAARTPGTATTVPGPPALPTPPDPGGTDSAPPALPAPPGDAGHRAPDSRPPCVAS